MGVVSFLPDLCSRVVDFPTWLSHLPLPLTSLLLPLPLRPCWAESSEVLWLPSGLAITLKVAPPCGGGEQGRVYPSAASSSLYSSSSPFLLLTLYPFLFHFSLSLLFLLPPILLLHLLRPRLTAGPRATLYLSHLPHSGEYTPGYALSLRGMASFPSRGV